MPESPPALDQGLRRIGARLRLVDAIGFTTNVLFAAVGLTWVLVLAGRLADWPQALLWALALGVLGLAAACGGLHWLSRRPSRLRSVPK